MDGAEGGVLVGAPHRELIHVRLANEHGIGLPQFCHDVRVIRRPESGEHLRGAGGRLVARAKGVFHRHGEAGEGPERLAGLAAGVDVGGAGQGRCTIDVQEGVDRAVHLRDPAQEGLGHLHRRHLTLADCGDEIDGGEFERLHGKARGGR